MQKKRVGPEPVDPVSYKGTRFEVIHWGKERGLGQNGGYLAAIDEASGDEQLIKVYDVIYDDEMEDDKQDLFIAKLALSRWRGRLTVEDERGGRYAVDLKTRAVTAL